MSNDFKQFLANTTSTKLSSLLEYWKGKKKNWKKRIFFSLCVIHFHLFPLLVHGEFMKLLLLFSFFFFFWLLCWSETGKWMSIIFYERTITSDGITQKRWRGRVSVNCVYYLLPWQVNWTCMMEGEWEFVVTVFIHG